MERRRNGNHLQFIEKLASEISKVEQHESLAKAKTSKLETRIASSERAGCSRDGDRRLDVRVSATEETNSTLIKEQKPRPNI